MLPESNMAFLDMSITHPALASKQNITISSGWPTAYCPATPQTLALQETNNSAVAAPQPSVFAGSAGTVTACNVDTGTTAIACHAPYFIV
jgi:hypothetical protein